jgi:hypothetical protein
MASTFGEELRCRSISGEKWTAGALGGILAAFSIACLFLWYWSQLSPPSTSAVFWSAAWSVVFMVLVSVLLVVASTGIEFLAWFSVGSLGAALGWILGIYISPSSPEEASHFNQLGTAVAGLVSGAIVTHIGALWQKLIDGSEPRILQKRYAIPVLIFLGTGLISVAAQYNIRESTGAPVVVSLRHPVALARDQSSHLSVLEGQQSVQFFALVDHPADATVDEWRLDSDYEDVRRDIQDKKLAIDPKRGVLTSSLQGATGDKTLKVIAVSHWNHAWQGQYLVQLGTKPVQTAKATTAAK